MGGIVSAQLGVHPTTNQAALRIARLRLFVRWHLMRVNILRDELPNVAPLNDRISRLKSVERQIGNSLLGVVATKAISRQKRPNLLTEFRIGLPGHP